MVLEINITKEQQAMLNIIPSFAAVTSICCAVYIVFAVLRSKYYRSRIYHRIMLGCGINIIILDISFLWGATFIPVGGGASCSASGFLYQYAIGVTPSYYFTLSILSFIAFRNKYNFSKIAWIEKLIHIGIHTLCFGSSLYLLSIEAFNPVATGCSLTSMPVGCGDGSGVTCERGPQNIAQLQMIFWGIPSFIILSGSVLVMIMLYLHVRNREKRTTRTIAFSVARQSGLYILILVLIYSFRIIHTILVHGVGVYFFTISLLADTNESLIGMWILITYCYFRSDDPSTSQENNDDDNNNQVDPKGGCLRRPIEEWFSISQRITLNSWRSTLSSTRDDDYNNNDTTNNEDLDDDTLDKKVSSYEIKKARSKKTLNKPEYYEIKKPRSKSSKKPEFSIFDGNTIPEDSPWAEFLTKGEDDEYNSGVIWQQ